MSTSLSSLYIVNRRPAELCLESDVALCRGGERCTQEGQTDGASLQPGSAWRRLDAPKPLPVAPASEPAENRRALKSSSHLSGGAGTPGRGPGGAATPSFPPPETTDAHARGGPPPTLLEEKPRGFLPALPPADHGTSGRLPSLSGCVPTRSGPGRSLRPASALQAASAPGGEAAWPSASLRPIWPRGPAFSCL